MPMISHSTGSSPGTSKQQTVSRAAVSSQFQTTTPTPELTLDDVLCGSFSAQLSESAKQLAQTILWGWINYYTDYYAEIGKEVKKLEADAEQKDIPQLIRKSIEERINSVTKCSTIKELAKLRAFFLDLIEGVPVQVESAALDALGESPNSLEPSSVTIQLTPEEDPQYKRYAMWIICTHFIQQVKCDPELINSAMMVITGICLLQPEFHQLLKAVCLNESTFMKMSGKEVLDKLLTLISTPSEVATNWIASETGVFQIFCRIEASFSSRQDFRLEAKQPQKVKGTELLRMFLFTTLEMPSPVLMASPFVVAELLSNSFIAERENSYYENNFANLLRTTLLPRAQAIIDFNWEPLLLDLAVELRHGGGDNGDGGKSESLLRSLHGRLIRQLQDAIQKAPEMERQREREKEEEED